MKATSEEYAFHQRILARDDPVAFAAFAEWLYFPLIQDVCKRAGSHTDTMLIKEAVGQALLDYHDHPERYDPERAALHSYLCMAAFRDFQNAQAKEHRLQRHQLSLTDPAFPEWEMATATSQDIDSIEGQEQAEELWDLIDQIFPEPTERRIVLLIINNVHSPDPYAELLGLCDVPYEQRVKQVQQVKYRIARRLRRNVAKHYYHGKEVTQ